MALTTIIILTPEPFKLLLFVRLNLLLPVVNCEWALDADVSDVTIIIDIIVSFV